MKRLFLSILFVLIIIVISTAQTERLFNDILDTDTLSLLEQDGEILRFLKQDEKLSLIPAVSSRQQVREDYSQLNPTIGVEILLLFKNVKPNLDSREGILSIYNVLRSISTLEGIEYYSVTRDRMRTLFYESYVIDSPDDKNKRPDPIVSYIPGQSSIYVYQNDSTFGENVYIVNYRYYGNHVSMEMQNMNTIWYFILPLVDPDKLKYYIMVIPEQDNILFYGIIAANALNLFGIAESKAESFYNRIKAIANWFIGRL